MKEKNCLIEESKKNPIIYAYIAKDSLGKPHNEGYIKIGYTERNSYATDVDNAMERIKEQTHTAGLIPELLKVWKAVNYKNEIFTDKDIHKKLKELGYKQLNAIDDNNEWYNCDLNTLDEIIQEFQTGETGEALKLNNFSMRPEQATAVEQTIASYNRQKADNKDAIARMLWNCKMRFGKCFATGNLIDAMSFGKTLIVTAKPAVEDSWKTDFTTHKKFVGWHFISNHSSSKSLNKQYEESLEDGKPIVCFVSLQDLLGRAEDGAIKVKNEFIHKNAWDLVVIDEEHYGSWTDKAQSLFEQSNKSNSDTEDGLFIPIVASYYLYMSGTAFKTLNKGEFLEDQIFTWTYMDEQKAKMEWNNDDGPNPYACMPKMNIYTYNINEAFGEVAIKSEINSFSLNEFFKAEGHGCYPNDDTIMSEADYKRYAHFVHEDKVQKLLDMMCANYSHLDLKELGYNIKDIVFPYTGHLKNKLDHTVWCLPDVASCEAMYNLLRKGANNFYYVKGKKEIICCAGDNVGVGIKALEAVKKYIDDEKVTNTITLTCGKLDTGVTVKQWFATFMMSDTVSPQFYFQMSFRGQSPYVSKDGKVILKPDCYVFDFSANRALKLISDYATKLDISDISPAKKIDNFIKFLPILAFNGSTMEEIDGESILDWTLNGMTSNMLVKKWEDSSNLNLDITTLKNFISNKEAMNILNKIKVWRALKRDISITINETDFIKKLKSKSFASISSKKEVDAEIKTLNKMQKEIQTKLIHLLSNLANFLYITDCQEQSINDVINTHEIDEFNCIMGITPKEFNTLIETGIYNRSKLDTLCYLFNKYNEPNLTYLGINKHEGEEKGLCGIDIDSEVYHSLYNDVDILID